MNSPSSSLLRRWLSLLMVGLLALGPFLHSHFGASHDTGFHLDGVHAVHAADATGLNALQASEEESPAMGVSASLPQPEDDGQTGWVLALLLTLLALLPMPCQSRLHPARPRPLAGSVYRAGLPPPCLAPPTL